MTVGSNIFTVEEISYRKVYGQKIGHRDGVESIAGGAINRTHILIALLEGFYKILAVIKNNP